MAIELRILSGARAGQSQTFQKSTITIGRDPSSDLRFDTMRDLDVSTKHAEIRAIDGRYVLVDTESTNGTFVNGKRMSRGEERPLAQDDVIGFGPHGPTVGVRVGPAAPLAKRPTRERIAVAVREETRGLRAGIVAVVVVLAIFTAGGVWFQHRQAVERAVMLERLRKVYAEQARQQAEVTRRSLNEPDWAAMRDANDSAVVLIASQIGAQQYEATGFSINAAGLIVTSRHVVSDNGRRATRIGAKFANMRAWHSAHLVKVSADPGVDLALVQIDDAGKFPVVQSLANAVDVEAGGTIATIGFPLGTDIPMEGTGNDLAAKTTLTVGTLSKAPTHDLLQIDAFASHGSSGSPVFDGHGHVIGVVYGGPKDTAGRIVYAVPVERLMELLISVK